MTKWYIYESISQFIYAFFIMLCWIFESLRALHIWIWALYPISHVLCGLSLGFGWITQETTPVLSWLFGCSGHFHFKGEHSPQSQVTLTLSGHLCICLRLSFPQLWPVQTRFMGSPVSVDSDALCSPDIVPEVLARRLNIFLMLTVHFDNGPVMSFT